MPGLAGRSSVNFALRGYFRLVRRVAPRIWKKDPPTVSACPRSWGPMRGDVFKRAWISRNPFSLGRSCWVPSACAFVCGNSGLGRSLCALYRLGRAEWAGVMDSWTRFNRRSQKRRYARGVAADSGGGGTVLMMRGLRFRFVCVCVFAISRAKQNGRGLLGSAGSGHDLTPPPYGAVGGCPGLAGG